MNNSHCLLIQYDFVILLYHSDFDIENAHVVQLGPRISWVRIADKICRQDANRMSRNRYNTQDARNLFKTRVSQIRSYMVNEAIRK